MEIDAYAKEYGVSHTGVLEMDFGDFFPAMSMMYARNRLEAISHGEQMERLKDQNK